MATRQLERVFDSYFRVPTYYDRETNVVHTDDKCYLEMKICGVEPKDLDISIEKDVLKVSYESKTKSESDLWSVRGAESFSKSFRVSSDYDLENIDANMKNGILTITLNKCVNSRLRKIPVLS